MRLDYNTPVTDFTSNKSLPSKQLLINLVFLNTGCLLDPHFQNNNFLRFSSFFCPGNCRLFCLSRTIRPWLWLVVETLFIDRPFNQNRRRHKEALGKHSKGQQAFHSFIQQRHNELKLSSCSCADLFCVASSSVHVPARSAQSPFKGARALCPLHNIIQRVRIYLVP